jgi:hypothetical protein
MSLLDLQGLDPACGGHREFAGNSTLSVASPCQVGGLPPEIPGRFGQRPSNFSIMLCQ